MQKNLSFLPCFANYTLHILSTFLHYLKLTNPLIINKVAFFIYHLITIYVRLPIAYV